MKLVSKFGLTGFFILVASFWLIAMSIIIPVSQVPDEYKHFEGMMNTFGTEGFTGETTVIYYGEAGLTNFNEGGPSDLKTIDVDRYISSGMHRYESKYSLSDMHFSLSAIKYLPAALGFYLGVLFGLPKLICLQMAELFSAIFFVIMGALAIKVAPFKKEVFLFTLLMPMTIQQCSSISPDVVVISCSILAIAYILNMKFRDGKVTWKDILIISLLLIAIFIAKMIYVLIFAMVLIVPLDKYSLPLGKKIDLADYIRKYKWIVFTLLMIFIALGVFLCRNQYFFKVLFACLLQPGRTYVLFKATIFGLIDFYIRGLVGCFGWLDISLPWLYVIAFFVMLFYINLFIREEEFEKYKKLVMWNRILMIGVGVAIFVLIFLSMASWSFELEGFNTEVDLATMRGYLYKIDSFLGVQGRYFIPIIPLIVVPIGSGNVLKNKKTYYIAQIGYYVLSMIFVVKLLTTRYWG